MRETALAHPLLFSALFDNQVAERGKLPALVSNDLTWTYTDLTRKADGVADALTRLGLPPQAAVAVCFDRSPWTIAAVLGIWRAGAVFVPLDASYPVARLAFMAEDSAIKAIITDRSALPIAAGACARDIPRILADDIGATISGTSRSALTTHAGAEDPAYIIYTSGSTGRPKGVVIPHRGIGNLALTQGYAFGVSQASRVLQFASIGFDAFVAEMVVTLAAGASLHLATRADLLPDRPLQMILSSRGITHATLPPSLLASMPESAIPSGLSLILAGEPSSPALVARYAPGRRLFNAYGPTEATVCATMGPCQADGQLPPIGTPLPHVRMMVVGPDGTEVSPGQTGELWIGGIGVALGYVNHPELTAERFPIRHGARWYRSGDSGRLRADGSFEFLGRKDRQVKIRGHRIELEEIEATLAAHPSVEAAAVVLHREPDQLQLVAFTTGQPGALPNADLIRTYLAEHLPGWMLPGRIVPLPSLPLTTSGKIDRQRLKDMALDGSNAGGPTLAPRDGVELSVSLIVAEVLGLPRVGVHDEFFALGGNSLAAARVIARIETELGHRLPLSAFIGEVTPARLAARIRSTRGRDAWSPAIRLATGPETEPVILVHPAGGTVLAYADLARAIAGKRSVFGIQANGYEPGQHALSDVATMARTYLAALAHLRPRRWCFAGWSFGALIAFEMTRQARQAGWLAAPPIAIDAAFLHPRMMADDADIVGRVVSMYADMLDIRPRELAGQQNRNIPELVGAAVSSGIFPEDFDTAQAHRLAAVIAGCFAAGAEYRPDPIDGRVVLIRAKDNPMQVDDPLLGWGDKATGGIDLRWAPGTHTTMLRPPHASALARLLEDVLMSPDS